MHFSKQSPKSLWLLALVLLGLLITSPYFNFQDYLSQGDHGRDLYAAQAVYRGELPYRDFWWVYGPLTPYYYGLFFKIFGVKITSILLGKMLLRILGGVFLCLGLMEVASPMASLLAGCWYILFAQDFFFTYNHIAGVAMMLGVVWCLLSYIRQPGIKQLYRALVFIFILCLIKINFGLASLVVCLVSVAVTDALRREAMDMNKKIFYAAVLPLLVVVFIIYWSLLHGLSSMEIRECLPYKEGDQPYAINPWTAIANFAVITWRSIRSNAMNTCFALLINASILRTIYLAVKNKISNERKMLLGLAFGMLLLFYAADSHEYLKSGVWYRDFWAQPISIILTFLVIDGAAQSFNPMVRKIIFTLIAAMAFYCWGIVFQGINKLKTDEHLLSIPRTGIYVTNSPSWINTVEQTTVYLNMTLKPNELFMALPYDCLYYYLTDKRTPTRQLIFFDHIKIPPEQEKSVIGELQANHVNYILVSSRANAHLEPGLGQLGITYCPLIAKYIKDNFKPIARFGDWTNEPGWAWNHGTLILKRNGT